MVELASKAKISKFYVVLFIQVKVVHFEIPVNDVFGVDVDQTLNDLPHIAPDGGLGELCHLSELLFQVLL